MPPDEESKSGVADDLKTACRRFVDHLEERIVRTARGDDLYDLSVEPEGSFWLGQLVPEEVVIEKGLGERGERLDPCAVGIRVKPREGGPWSFVCDVEFLVWLRDKPGKWRKSPSARVSLAIEVLPEPYISQDFGREEIASALEAISGEAGLGAELRAEVSEGYDGTPELAITLVNVSPKDSTGFHDPNLYETKLRIHGLDCDPFLSESLPGSFRYDRDIAAYGINCGVVVGDGYTTADVVRVDRGRPSFWNSPSQEPDLRFETLASDPIEPLHALRDALEGWGDGVWSEQSLKTRAEEMGWGEDMLAEAQAAAAEFHEEAARIRGGIALLEEQSDLMLCFRLMNEGMMHSAAEKYDRWRPFQVAFLLANISAISHPEDESGTAEIVWFATGGGKTETYLGLLMMAALHDRLKGKVSGITAWSRFPLRMLSLQQTQRFADAMAGAELARRRASIQGDSISVGFFVGMGATPNEIKTEPLPHEPDPDDPGMPEQFRVLLHCPFCRSGITMGFDRALWKLEHRCTNDNCPWPEKGLPFYVVDQEIYRFLPTVLVGTLDKAAAIAWQAAMRGLVGAPRGLCSLDGHGYLYAPRSSRPNGCLVPGCQGKWEELRMETSLFGISFRLQDELHLLRDSLGAVDSHYESLLDHLEESLTGRRAKILASSATLEGFTKQVEVLYQRDARVFPTQGPTSREGFWRTETDDLARRYVAIAPRGTTLDFANDRIVTELQLAVRRLYDEPEVLCEEIKVNPELAPELLSIYGTDVIYGTTIRDLDAAARSLETQVPVEPLRAISLTGTTPFEDVRSSLDSLQNPEESFEDRIHVIAASSMMSHGVDIDRLNVMVMLGLPLTTAEFIQTTARVGRRWPGLVFVLHRPARERDASTYRSFTQFIEQGDRFVEPIPVTRRSRRVLERTIAGLELARILAIHEAQSGLGLTTVSKLRAYLTEAEVSAQDEFAAIVEALGIQGDIDAPMREDLERWYKDFFRNLLDPGGTFRFPSELSPTGPPMFSLRDVEEQAPVRSSWM